MKDLLSIQDWFYANKLTLNLPKTVYLFFENKGHMNTDLDLTDKHSEEKTHKILRCMGR